MATTTALLTADVTSHSTTHIVAQTSAFHLLTNCAHMSTLLNSLCYELTTVCVVFDKRLIHFVINQLVSSLACLWVSVMIHQGELLLLENCVHAW